MHISIEKLFDDAFWFFAFDGGMRKWATAPKNPPNIRVMNHFLKHQRRLENAQRSGIGAREVARRQRQLTTGFLRTN